MNVNFTPSYWPVSFTLIYNLSAYAANLFMLGSTTPDYTTQNTPLLFLKVCMMGGKSCASSVFSYVSVGNLFQHFDLQPTIKDH